MCGIFAYLFYGKRTKRIYINETLLAGLRRLEYRGYDSAGIAIDGDNNDSLIIKTMGSVDALQIAIEEMYKTGLDPDREFTSHQGIAHTRWATHGPPSTINAHPHASNDDCDFMIVHNGIITNYDILKRLLQSKGFTFLSDTDTEVIAKLCKYVYDEHSNLSFVELMMEVCSRLEGAFALVVKSTRFPDEVVGCKNGSPLILGIKVAQDEMITKSFSHSRITNEGVFSTRSVSGDLRTLSAELLRLPSPKAPSLASIVPEDRPMEIYLASDASAIVEHTRKVFYLEDDDFLHVDSYGNAVTFSRNKTTNEITKLSREMHELTMEIEQIMKGNFAHYMLKEIFEQPDSLFNTTRGRLVKLPNQPERIVLLGGIAPHLQTIRRCRRMIMFGCGTSFHSAITARPILEELADIPVQLELASDFQDRQAPIFRDDVCVFISQSGETKDTLNALEYCLSHGAFCIGITNTVGSAIPRKTHCGIHINAGAEIGVASTKAYTSQTLALIMFAVMLSEDRLPSQKRRHDIVAEISELPAKVAETLKLDGEIRKLAEELKDSKSLLLMGRGYEQANVSEGALKIKEISYIHSEGIHMGELKHGPLALVDEDMPVLVLCTQDKKSLTDDSRNALAESLYPKVKSSLELVRARAGKPIIITNHKEDPDIQRAAHKVITVPQTLDCLQPIVTVVVLQLLSYHLAVLRGHNVDRPRNLAKSVTV